MSRCGVVIGWDIGGVNVKIAVVDSGVDSGRILRVEEVPFELQRLHSAHAGLDGRHWTSTELGVRWSAGYEWEELSAERTRGRVTLSLGLEARL